MPKTMQSGAGAIKSENGDATLPCPLCGASSGFYAEHPEAELYRCPACTHCFTCQDTVEIENYHEDYFAEHHKRWFEHPNLELFERIAKKIPNGASVLDAGCGRGDFLRHMRLIRPDLTLTGIDLSANKDEEGIKYYQDDLLTMDLKGKGPYDAVVSLAVIEHVTDVCAFIRRLKQVTKLGGLVVIMTLNDDSLLYHLARMGKRVGVPLAFNRVYSKHHLHHFTRRSLREVLTKQGLTVESEIVHNAPMAAIDIPVRNIVMELGLLGCLSVVFFLGRMTQSSFLQTIFCRNENSAQ